MSEYSVETKNRFQLILDDDDVDVFDLIKKDEEAKLNAKKSEVSKNAKNTHNSNEKKDISKKAGQQKNYNANVTNVNARNDKISTSARNNQDKRPRQSHEDRKQDNFEKPPSEAPQSGSFGGRGSRRGSGNFRGSRGGARGGNTRRLDRHSRSERTGVKPVEKREGSGSHNWGSAIDSQLDNSVQDEQDVGERTEGDGAETINEENTGADGEQLKPAEPEVREMTLDEWRAAQASTRTKREFNVRRPGEGEDPQQWKKTVALEPRKRAESTDSFEDEDLQDKVENTRFMLNKLNIQIKFSNDDNPRSAGASRGGRGRGRGFGSNRPPRSGGFGGRRGRGGYNNNGGYSRQENSAPKMDNEFEFPSLGSK